MRGTAILVVLAIAVVAAPAAEAQKRQKDPVLEQYLISEFTQLNAKLERMAERLAAAEAELARLKQSGTDLLSEVRNTQTTAKTTDTSLANFRLSTQQDLLSLKTDLTQIRQDLMRVADAVKSSAPPAAAAPGPSLPAAEAQPVDGYITAVSSDAKEVNINLGSGAGLRLGSEFDVFKASDPKTKIGIIEVLEVIDANNSRAKVVYVRQPNRLEFSDIVRPRS